MVFHTNPCNFEISKLSCNLFLTHLRVQVVCYELKGDLSLVMLNEIFYDSFENFEITRIFSGRLTVSSILSRFYVMDTLHLTELNTVNFQLPFLIESRKLPDTSDDRRISSLS